MKDLHPRIIQNREEWQILKAALAEKGYTLFQLQYDAKEAEGFRAWFVTSERRVEIITHDSDVQKAIVKYKL
jgi:hypothetical protein